MIGSQGEMGILGLELVQVFVGRKAVGLFL